MSTYETTLDLSTSEGWDFVNDLDVRINYELEYDPDEDDRRSVHLKFIEVWSHKSGQWQFHVPPTWFHTQLVNMVEHRLRTTLDGLRELLIEEAE